MHSVRTVSLQTTTSTVRDILLHPVREINTPVDTHIHTQTDIKYVSFQVGIIPVSTNLHSGMYLVYPIRSVSHTHITHTVK